MNEIASTRDKAPLDELMLAMDVVDTLRHREQVVARELDAEGRDAELRARLHEIYAGQGIDVSDEIIERGVRALREDRFVYVPTAPSLDRSLARIYVSRGRWGKPLLSIAVIGVLLFGGLQTFVWGPERAAIASLPTELASAYAAVESSSEDDSADQPAAELLAQGQVALDHGDYADAESAIAGLNELVRELERTYELRIVSRPGELSGVWRVPDVNTKAQNFYLIVEAVTPDGSVLQLPVRNEEDGQTHRVSKWGVRVDEATFRSVADDKQDDGIIQKAVVAVKPRGTLALDYELPTLGGMITDW